MALIHSFAFAVIIIIIIIMIMMMMMISIIVNINVISCQVIIEKQLSEHVLRFTYKVFTFKKSQ